MKQPTIQFTVPVLKETFTVYVVEVLFINNLTTKAITIEAGWNHIEWKISNTKNPDGSYNCSTRAYGEVEGVFRFQE